MKYIISLFFIISVCGNLNAQQVIGVAFDGDRNDGAATLPGAHIYWEGTANGVTTGADGRFSIEMPQGGGRLIASFTGYHNDTVEIAAGSNQVVEFTLSEGVTLGETVVSARRKGSYLSRITPVQTEIITGAGLQKMACCNLAESFENSATVTVGFTDAVSGAKQIQMLGLSGVYTQMLDENIPTMRGLASSFGWNYVPGPWLESIQVSKGTSSVVNGYESTTGQINLEFRKPDLSETLFLNLFGAADGRMEANLTSAAPVGEKLWTGVMLHGSTEQTEHDANDDGFMDMPKTKLFNIYNRWQYENPEKGVESRTGIKLLHDKRIGGHLSSIGEQPAGAMPRYQTNIENSNISVFNKTGIAFGRREGQSIGIINSFTHHEIESAYGAKQYGGKQNTFYSNVLVSSFLANETHKYVVGASFLYDRFDETYSDTLAKNSVNTPMPVWLAREEIVPGAFAQYTYSYQEKLTVMAGVRGDYHNRYGMLFTPRANVKYNFTDDIIFRVSAGRGYRSANVIAENIGYLASSRRMNVWTVNDLDIEKAWNYGANFTFYIHLPEERTITVGMDYYRTDFDNQAIVDMEYDRQEIYFYNLQGRSYANAWQLDVQATPFKGFDVFAAFRLSDTRVTYSHNVQQFTADKPLSSKYRGLLNFSYATNFEKWKIDVTAQFNGSSRLPGLSEGGYSAAEERSPAYPIYFAQITKKTKRLDIYAGCENILNYKQKNPIVEANDPFGLIFDASRIWGPLMGRKFYAGIRLRIGEIK